MIKVFKFNEHNKIEFTQKELENLLNEIYKEGYNEGKNWYTWTSPYYYSSAGNNYNITTTGNDSLKDKIEIRVKEVLK